MSIDSKAFTRYAKAEKEFCKKVAPMLESVVRDIEQSYGIAIAEIRVTIDRLQPDRELSANCVLVGEDPGDERRDTDADDDAHLDYRKPSAAAPLQGT